MTYTTIPIMKATTVNKSITVYEADSATPRDITGWTIFFTLKRNIADPDSLAILTKDITVHTDPTNGVSQLALSADDTDIYPDTYFYDLKFKTAEGEIAVPDDFPGRFEVHDTVTDRES